MDTEGFTAFVSFLSSKKQINTCQCIDGSSLKCWHLLVPQQCLRLMFLSHAEEVPR